MDAVDKCSGEATVNNRKGKLIFFYEWELVLKWSGRLLSNSKLSHKGKLTIPNLSEENDLDAVEITVTIDESNDESETLKQFMYNVGRDRIRQQLGTYIKELKEEYSRNLILPKKGAEGSESSTSLDQKNAAKNTAAQKAAAAAATSASNVVSNSSSSSIGCKLDVRTLSMTEEFHCSANDLYNALTKPDMVTAFTRAPAKVDAVRGGEWVSKATKAHRLYLQNYISNSNFITGSCSMAAMYWANSRNLCQRNESNRAGAWKTGHLVTTPMSSSNWKRL